MKKRNLSYLAAALLLSCALLAGCNGGGGESSAAPTEPTPSASDTTEPATEPTTEPSDEAADPTQPEQGPTEPEETPTDPEEEPTGSETTPTQPEGGDDQPGEPTAEAAELAKAQLGKPYRYGSAGPDAFDNSGLLYYCYGQAGITVPRRTGDLYSQGTAVEKADLQPGDAVFFWNTNEGNPEFAAIYVGDGICIAARQEDTPVSELNMTYPYFEEHYVGARRYTAG